MGNNKLYFFVAYLIIGLYFVNIGITFIKIPEAITEYNNWISLVGGILIIIGSFNFLRTGKNPLSTHK